MLARYLMLDERVVIESKLLQSRKFFIKQIGNNWCEINNSWMIILRTCIMEMYIEVKSRAHLLHLNFQQMHECEFLSLLVLQMRNKHFSREEILQGDLIFEIMVKKLQEIILTQLNNQFG